MFWIGIDNAKHRNEHKIIFYLNSKEPNHCSTIKNQNLINKGGLQDNQSKDTTFVCYIICKQPPKIVANALANNNIDIVLYLVFTCYTPGVFFLSIKDIIQYLVLYFFFFFLNTYIFFKSNVLYWTPWKSYRKVQKINATFGSLLLLLLGHR